VALTLLTVIPERVQVQTPTTAGRDASYKLNVVAEARSGVRGWGEKLLSALVWNEIMGSYSAPDTMVEIGA